MDWTTTRRQWLMGSAAASMLSAQTTGNPIRTGFIGIGVRGSSLVPQVLEQPGTRVTAICDIDPKARDTGLTIAKRDSPKAFSDWRKILDSPDIDAVVVATCLPDAVLDGSGLKPGKIFCSQPGHRQSLAQ